MLHHVFFENPTPLFLVVFLAAFFVFNRVRRDGASMVRTLGAAFGVVAILGFATLLVLNCFRGGLLWHDEANILSIAAAWHHGQAMYLSADSGDFYTLFYGPITFLLSVPLLYLSSHSLLGPRIVISLVDALSIFFLFRLVRIWLAVPESLALLTLAIAALSPYPDELLGLRGDPWLLFFSVIAFWMVMRPSAGRGYLQMVIAGIALGLAIGLKITVAPIACVAIVLALYRLGRTSAVVVAMTTAILTFAPFCLHGISLRNYSHSLLIAGHQPFLRSTLLLNVLVLLLLLSPLLYPGLMQSVRARRQQEKSAILFLAVIAVGVCVVTGSKFSAGPWHLWPLIPMLLLAASYELKTFSEFGRRSDEESARHSVINTPVQWKAVLAASVTLAGGVVTLLFCFHDVRIFKPLLSSSFRNTEMAESSELHQFETYDSNRDLVMGAGQNVNDERTNLRYELTLNGKRYVFDENEVVEGEKASMPIPPAVLANLRSCQDDWLLPHGDVPFSAVRGGLVPGDASLPMFPDDFRASFLSKYSLVKKGEAYDLWSCRSAQAKPPSA